jgi:hypothetical protein
MSRSGPIHDENNINQLRDPFHQANNCHISFCVSFLHGVDGNPLVDLLKQFDEVEQVFLFLFNPLMHRLITGGDKMSLY